MESTTGLLRKNRKMKDTSPKQWADTGLAVILILLMSAGYTKNSVYILPAILATLMTMTWPKFFYPFSILWFGFSHFMGNIVSRIVLGIIFFLVVVPVGLLRRIGKNDSMGFKKWKSGTDSVFVKRDHLFCADDFDKPF